MNKLFIAVAITISMIWPAGVQASPQGGFGGSSHGSYSGGHGGGYNTGGYSRNYYGSGYHGGYGGRYYGGSHYGYPGYGYYGGGYRGYYGGWGWGLPVAAFATGALLTSAYYSQPYYYDYGSPAYYSEAPVYRTRVVREHRTVAAERSGLELDVQAALRTKGYYTGSLDGIYGPQTADAIRRFQVDNGIAETGKINGDTLKALGL